MKRVFFFHGLESKQGGQRIDYLTRSFLVHAPQMKYKQPQTWPQTVQKVQKTHPQIVIGSSMGGLMAFHCAYSLDCKLLLFNPAFDRIPQYIPGWKSDGGEQKAQIEVVLGKNDTDVDPLKTIAYLGDNKIKANVTWLEIQHRVSVEIFIQQFERFGKKIGIL